jgi:hypothetical protein
MLETSQNKKRYMGYCRAVKDLVITEQPFYSNRSATGLLEVRDRLPPGNTAWDTLRRSLISVAHHTLPDLWITEPSRLQSIFESHVLLRRHVTQHAYLCLHHHLVARRSSADSVPKDYFHTTLLEACHSDRRTQQQEKSHLIWSTPR